MKFRLYSAPTQILFAFPDKVTGVTPGTGSVGVTGGDGSSLIVSHIGLNARSGPRREFWTAPTRAIFWPKPFGVQIEPGTCSLGLTGAAPALTPLRIVIPATCAITFTGNSFAPLTSRKWQTYVAPTQIISFSSGAPTSVATPGSGSLSLTAAAPVSGSVAQPLVGSLVFSGSASLIARDVRPQAGSLTLTGSSVFTPSPNIRPGAGSLALTGFEPPDAAGTVYAPIWQAYAAPSQIIWWFSSTGNPPITGALSIDGYAPTVVSQVGARQPNAGALTLAGSAPVLGKTFTITPDAGSVVFTGSLAQPQGQGQIITQTGSLNLGGRDATQDIAVRPDVGEVVVEGQLPDIGTGLLRTPVVGSLAFAGVAPEFILGLGRQPDAGSLVLDGVESILSLDEQITPDVGELGISVEDEPSQPDVAEEMVLAGYAPSLRYINQLVPETCEIVVSGQNTDVSGSDQSSTKTPATGSLNLHSERGIDIELLRPITPQAFGTLFNRPRRGWMYRPWTRR